MYSFIAKGDSGRMYVIGGDFDPRTKQGDLRTDEGHVVEYVGIRKYTILEDGQRLPVYSVDPNAP